MATAVFSAIATAVGTILSGGKFVFKLGAKTFTGYQAFIGWTATYAVLGAIAQGLFGQGKNDTRNGINFNVRDPASTRKIIYGKCRIGGTVVFFNTSDTDNNYLHMVIAVAGHEIESFEEVYFDDEKVWENGSYLNDWDDHCLLNFHDGSQTTADSTLVGAGTGWTNDHILRDTAYVYIRHDYDAEKYVKGVPNVSFVVKGKKVYDPATDTTAWSDNPALILRDYLTDTDYGLGEDATNIDTAAVNTAKAVCNEDMATSETETQTKYTCNGVLDSGSSIKANIENILTSMMGSLHWSNGKFYMLAHKYVDPVADQVTEDMIVAPIQVSTKRSRSSLYNTVKGNFVSEEANYIVSDYPAQSIASYVTNDGEDLALDLGLPMTTDNFRAQRIAYLTMKKSRLQMTVKLQLNLNGLKYKVGDNIEIVNSRFGWTSASPKVFEITNFQLVPDPERGIIVNIDAVENEDVDDWTGGIVSDFELPTPPDVYTGTTVVAPTNLRVYAVDRQTSSARKNIKVIWDGVQESDGADPYEPYFKHYRVTVTHGSSGYVTSFNTTETSALVTVSQQVMGKSGAIRATTVDVRAVNGRDYRSDPLSSGDLFTSTLYPFEPLEEPKKFYGTQENPTESYLTQLVQDSGARVLNGMEILYVYIDSNGDPVSSAEYEFTTEDFIVHQSTDMEQTEVGLSDYDELITNGTFSTNSDWTTTSAFWSITSGTLVCSGGAGGLIFQLFTVKEPGTHVVTFEVDALDSTSMVCGINEVIDGASNQVLSNAITSTGTNTFEFEASSKNLILSFGRGGTGGITIDNVSVKKKIPDATEEFILYLPDTVTSDVTFAHTESDEINQPNNTGVTETYTGFSGANLEANNRKYVKVRLTRSKDNVGFSQLKTTVTASWTDSTSSFGSVTKTAEKEITLTARVVT